MSGHSILFLIYFLHLFQNFGRNVQFQAIHMFLTALQQLNFTVSQVEKKNLQKLKILTQKFYVLNLQMESQRNYQRIRNS